MSTSKFLVINLTREEVNVIKDIVGTLSISRDRTIKKGGVWPYGITISLYEAIGIAIELYINGDDYTIYSDLYNMYRGDYDLTSSPADEEWENTVISTSTNINNRLCGILDEFKRFTYSYNIDCIFSIIELKIVGNILLANIEVIPQIGN